ncbi:MAG TPA: hypothetical protein VK364_01130, partial [Hymenobacter sp.]|nr:hypothetical protein [Hymenobacter sp.]
MTGNPSILGYTRYGSKAHARRLAYDVKQGGYNGNLPYSFNILLQINVRVHHCPGQPVGNSSRLVS